MLKNYFITAYRNLLRKRATTFFNVTGLTLGIAGSIVLFLLVNWMLSFDTFQENYLRIYRVVTDEKSNGGEEFHTPGVPNVLPVAFRNDFTEAEHVTLTAYFGDDLILVPKQNDEPTKYSEESGVGFVEQTFFNIFTVKVLHGDIYKALDEPNEVVLAKANALKYFQKENAIGEVLLHGDQQYKVTAIVDDPPSNTNFPFTVLLSYETVRKSYEEQGWGSTSSNNQCYFLLKEGEQISSLENRMKAFTDKYIGKDNYGNRIFRIQPLNELHYDTRYYGYSNRNVSRGNILALVCIAAFLVITGCINFVNLSTAESIKRSKEVGIRKTLGSSRKQLIAQFLGESAIVTLVSIVLAIGLSQLVLLYLNPFMELTLSLDFLSNSYLIVFIAAIFIGVTVLSGLYPALIMSGYKPALVMKSKATTPSSTTYFMRKGLVVFQFFISQLLIMGTIVIVSQMNYFRSKDLGYNSDAVVTIPIPERERAATDTTKTASKMRTLKTEIMRIAGVEAASLCNTPPSSGSVNGTGFILEGESDEQRKDTQVKNIDGDYAALFGLKMLAGENIQDRDTTTGYLVNREFARVAGFTNPQDIVGKRIRVWGGLYPVMGVVEDFHTTSLHDKIEPTVLFNRISNYRNLSIKVNQKAFQQSVASIQKLWEDAYPKHVFSYSFLDDRIKDFYEGEEKMSKLLTVFTSVAIIIGCIGLFGLATFMANQKNKEIGIRKVLGASVNGIVFSFSKEYIVLIAVSFALAAPFAWYVMNLWLNEFAYKITMGPVIFVSGLLTTLLIAVLTAGYKSFQAASANPVNSLRSE